MDRPDTNDPRRLLPLAKPLALGLGVETVDQLHELIRRDNRFPPILKIGGKNYVLAGDRDVYREQLISDALKEATASKKLA
jgi:hypothetical protein